MITWSFSHTHVWGDDATYKIFFFLFQGNFHFNFLSPKPTLANVQLIFVSHCSTSCKHRVMVASLCDLGPDNQTDACHQGTVDSSLPCCSDLSTRLSVIQPHSALHFLQALSVLSHNPFQCCSPSIHAHLNINAAPVLLVLLTVWGVGVSGHRYKLYYH